MVPWYKDGLCFDCRQSGNCCSGAPGYVWVTKAEIRRIAEFLGKADGRLDPAQFRRVVLRFSLTEERNGDCVFLRRNGKRASCAIYPVRPKQCRTWPFWTENLRTMDAWEASAESCPGMNRGKRHDVAQIERVRAGFRK